jgi:hypothetical protein
MGSLSNGEKQTSRPGIGSAMMWSSIVIRIWKVNGGELIQTSRSCQSRTVTVSVLLHMGHLSTSRWSQSPHVRKRKQLNMGVGCHIALCCTNRHSKRVVKSLFSGVENTGSVILQKIGNIFGDTICSREQITHRNYRSVTELRQLCIS